MASNQQGGPGQQGGQGSGPPLSHPRAAGFESAVRDAVQAELDRRGGGGGGGQDLAARVAAVESALDGIRQNMASKDDLRLALEPVRSEVGTVRIDVTGVRTDVGGVRTDVGALRSEIAKVPGETLKMMIALLFAVATLVIAAVTLLDKLRAPDAVQPVQAVSPPAAVEQGAGAAPRIVKKDVRTESPRPR